MARACVVALMLLTNLAALAPPAQAQATRTPVVDFRSAMRKLWEDHITWTRLYIVSAAADLPDKDVTAQRLLQNQTDIGNAVKPTFGAAAGDRLTALLREHILGAVALIDAAKAKDTARVDAASKAWYANGDEIATFLSGANPQSWPLETMKMQMKMHLDLTLPEATNRLAGRFADDARDYDRIHDHILPFADVLSTGLLAAAAAPAPQAAAPAPQPAAPAPQAAPPRPAPTQLPTQLPRTGAAATWPAAGLAAASWLMLAGGWLLRRRARHLG